LLVVGQTLGYLSCMTIEAEQTPRSLTAPFDVASTTFPLIRRGYDPAQVTWFLQGVAEDVADRDRRIGELEAELEAAAEELRTVHRIDESTVAHFLGEETARMLTTARDTAADLSARAETRAAAAIADAEAHAAQVRHDADAYAAAVRHEADTDTRRQRKETDAACAATIEDAEYRAAKIIEAAEARRHQILADLSRRRDMAAAQFRELMAGRDELVRSLHSVEATAQRLTADLGDFSVVPASFVNLDETVQSKPVADPDTAAAVTRLSVRQ
jgi:DivIVA domain-containing protein